MDVSNVNVLNSRSVIFMETDGAVNKPVIFSSSVSGNGKSRQGNVDRNEQMDDGYINKSMQDFEVPSGSKVTGVSDTPCRSDTSSTKKPDG